MWQNQKKSHRIDDKEKKKIIKHLYYTFIYSYHIFKIDI